METIIIMTMGSVIILSLVTVILNLLKKNEVYEDEIEKLYTQIEESEKNLEKVYGHIYTALSTMRFIDSLGIFENDDEVGTVFQELKEIVYELNSLIYEDEDGEKKTD